jgi:hypothetical protein
VARGCGRRRAAVSRLRLVRIRWAPQQGRRRERRWRLQQRGASPPAGVGPVPGLAVEPAEQGRRPVVSQGGDAEPAPSRGCLAPLRFRRPDWRRLVPAGPRSPRLRGGRLLERLRRAPREALRSCRAWSSRARPSLARPSWRPLPWTAWRHRPWPLRRPPERARVGRDVAALPDRPYAGRGRPAAPRCSRSGS